MTETDQAIVRMINAGLSDGEVRAVLSMRGMPMTSDQVAEAFARRRERFNPVDMCGRQYARSVG